MIKEVNTQKLWERYLRDRSVEVKNELVMLYIGLVKSIVLRMIPTYKGYSSYDDMLSCGVLGLMDAIEKYDAAKKVKFEYYAAMRIKGEIIDNIRKQDWAPSSLRRKIKTISNACSELEHQHHRMPTDEEVAAYLGMEEEEVQKTLEKSHMFNILYFEEMVQDDHLHEGSSNDEPMEEEVERTEMIKILGGFIEGLTERERMVITLYYYEEMTLKEIAQVLGVTESRTSQIHSKAVMMLRSRMDAVYAF
jgi:RNA polymerase sigma factor for flagellar operon FliA